jgi:hypothetical protein
MTDQEFQTYVHNQFELLNIKLEALNTKLEAYWQASGRIATFAWATLGIGVVAMIGTFVNSFIHR